MFLVEEMPGPRRRGHGAKQKQAGLVDRTFECHPAAQFGDALKTLRVQNRIRRSHQLRHVALSLPNRSITILRQPRARTSTARPNAATGGLSCEARRAGRLNV